MDVWNTTHSPMSSTTIFTCWTQKQLDQLGVYFYDRRPVNTILIAITRGGKGQTYIEPSFDVWTREKSPWNIFTTDPKGYFAQFVRRLANFYGLIALKA